MLKKILALALGSLAAACVASDADFEGTRDMPPNFSRVRGVPIPEKSGMDMGKTLIFGCGNNLIGRLNFSAPYNAAGVFDFYVKEMPAYGWEQISSIRGDPSILTYQKNDRVATLQISSSTVRGALVSMIISNKDMSMQNNSSITAAARPAADAGNSIERSAHVGTSAAGIPVYKSSDVKAAPGSLAIPEDASNRNHGSSSRGVAKLVD